MPGASSTLTIETWRAHYTLEHMAPQSMHRGDSSYEIGIYEDGLVDRLGNLLLLPGGLNSIVGNREWSDKVAIYGILSLKDRQVRLRKLDEYGPGKLTHKAKQLLGSADYMPFCRFVGKA